MVSGGGSKSSTRGLSSVSYSGASLVLVVAIFLLNLLNPRYLKVVKPRPYNFLPGTAQADRIYLLSPLGLQTWMALEKGVTSFPTQWLLITRLRGDPPT